MHWHELLFMHWPLAPGALRPLLPAGLELDTFEGQAWIGIVPFRMRNVRARFTPPIPGLSAFPELNVRTYVRAGGKAGVWFFSLDAAQPLAVRTARWLFHLPYFDARMSVSAHADQVEYASTRTHLNAPPASLRMRYGPTGPAYNAKPGELDDFLTNRLCLYSAGPDGTLYRGDIHHAPWPLQPAEAQIDDLQMTQQIGIQLPDCKPLLHYAHRLDVAAWRIRALPDLRA